MSADELLSIEDELLKDVTALNLKLIDTTIEHLHEGDLHVKVILHDDPEVLSSCAWSLIYVIGVLSFGDARPTGNSEIHFVEKDQWTVGDMLRGLAYANGRLYFSADYVRGRCVKTSVEIDRDGKIVIETMSRHEAVTRWVSRLQSEMVGGQ